ncbi:hypothetical protein [Caballeronia sp. AZ1_KS37]|uniref:hypothetical protein n=1 Tax=Caballeronia sp. AZ1_KS37 TaxID=2921756 RepID=UPI002027DE9C|nr:hypothetical protein [Caballeronia sp. AZ1_KS37]
MDNSPFSPAATSTTAVGAAVYTTFGLPLSDIVSIFTIIFLLAQLFAYSPRIWNTIRAWYLKMFKKDSKLFDDLADHTDIEH